MLAKKYRLAKEKDFKKIIASGRSFFSPSFRLRYLATNLDFSRLSVIVSAKISKKATVRNRLKRQMREIIRLNLKQIKPGYDILVYFKNHALGKDYHELEQEFISALKKLRLV